jgi:F0F1-type ATP synthase delta subunit
MNKKKIDKLIAISYRNDNLDQKIINKIATLISKSDLKKYINGLKLAENKKTLFISTPSKDFNIKKFRNLFPNKKIVLKEDSSLLLGIEVVDNDIVYEFTLKNSLDKIINYIKHNYD